MPALPASDARPGILDQQLIKSGRLHQELTKTKQQLSRPKVKPGQQPALQFHVELLCTCTRAQCETCTPRLQIRVTAEYLAVPGQAGYREAEAFIRLSDRLEDWSHPITSSLDELRKHLLRQRFLLGPCVRLWRNHTRGALRAA